MPNGWGGPNRRQDPAERIAHAVEQIADILNGQADEGAMINNALERIADSLEKIEAKMDGEKAAQATIDKLVAELKQHTDALKGASDANPA